MGIQHAFGVKPDNQKGFFISWSIIKGLCIGVISEKAIFKFGGKLHLFIEALIATNFFNPSIVKCSFDLII